MWINLPTITTMFSPLICHLQMISVTTLGWRSPCILPGWDFTPPPCYILLWLASCCGCSPSRIRWGGKPSQPEAAGITDLRNCHRSIAVWSVLVLVLLQTSRDICCVVFALFNVVWATLFLERWKRRGAELAYKWGTLDTPAESLEEPRPQFRVREAENLSIFPSSISGLFTYVLSLGREWSAAVPSQDVRSSTILRGGGVYSGGWSACPSVSSVFALSSWSCSSALSCRSVSCQLASALKKKKTNNTLQEVQKYVSCRKKLCFCLVNKVDWRWAMDFTGHYTGIRLFYE